VVSDDQGESAGTYLPKETLAHFSAAVRYEHGAISRQYMDERVTLIKILDAE
jgi:hypothetical protein